jgi:uncharacterized protein (TIGR03437 family)
MRFNGQKYPATLIFLGLAYSGSTSAQVPAVFSGGVVSAASWSSPVAPGELVSLFGDNLSPSAQFATGSWPFTLGGTSVTINGIRAPVFYVSPTQINLQVPAGLAVSIFNITTAKVVVTSPAGTSAPADLALTAANPGFFTADGSGCGQSAALNITPDGIISLNSPSNSAAPGDYISLFGTGFGAAFPQPPDGVPAQNATPLSLIPTLYIDNKPAFSPTYAGLAPGLAGVDQINFRVSPFTRNGCAVPVSVSQTFGSPPVTISVQAGRGQCTDPRITSYGVLSLDKTFIAASGQTPASTAEFATASFPSGPRAASSPGGADCTRSAMGSEPF